METNYICSCPHCVHSLSYKLRAISALSTTQDFMYIESLLWYLFLFLMTAILRAASSVFRKHVTNLHPSKPSGHYMYHQFNIQQYHVLPIEYIYVFCVDLRTNTNISLYNIN